MDAAGEEDLHLGGGFGWLPIEELLEHADLRLPQREARLRADMTAALGALEDELARSGLQELSQQAGRGHVQEGA